MKITKVIIEGMHNVMRKSYDLSHNLTYLHGPNGAGKSTVMQAIQLALLGYIPGSNKSTKEAIMRHSNGHTLAVVLHIDDNGQVVTVSRVWSGAGSSISSNVSITPDGYDIHKIIEELELPIFNFNEFMGLTANKMKDWFINFLPSSEMSIDWRAVLTEDAVKTGVPETEELQSLVNDTVKRIKTAFPNSEGSDLVRDVNGWLNEALSFKKKELERATSTIQSLIYHDDIDDSLDIDEINSQIKTYETLKSSKASYAIIAQRNNTINKQLADYADCKAESYDKDERYINASKELEQYEAQLDSIAAKIAAQDAKKSEIAADILDLSGQATGLEAIIKTKSEIAYADGICPFTKTSCESIQPLIAEYKKDVKDLKQQIAELYEEKHVKSKELECIVDTISHLVGGRSAYEQQLRVRIDTMNGIKNRYALADNLRSQIAIVPEFNDDRDFDALIKELRDVQVKYEANKKYNELIDKLTADKFAIDQEINIFKSWIKLTGVNGLQTGDDAIQPFLDLQDEMDTYLHAVFGYDIKSQFNLEAKANSFSFGIVRDEKYIPFTLLSSGEKCMYTLALMMSLVKVSKSPLKLILIDDLLDHLDDININKLFDALSGIEDIQMIFAGVKPVENTSVTVEVEK